MDTVGKPYLLQICLQGAELLVGAVALVSRIHSLEHTAQGQVVAVILVPEYVAAPLGGLGQIVHEPLLVERQVFKVGYAVAQYLDVGKAVDGIVEIRCFCCHG